MTVTVLVDANNIGRKHNDAIRLTANGMQTQAIIGCIKTAREMAVTFPDADRHIWLWDGKAQFRYDIHPGYKEKRNLPDPRRDASRQAWQPQVPFIKTALQRLGITQMLASHHEADDLAGIVVGTTKAREPLAEIHLASGDGDWIQLVRNGVTVFDPMNDAKRYTIDNLMDKVGYRTPYGFLEGKCLQGDSSDDIPGVGGIGEKGAPEFIAQFGSVRNFWKMIESGEFKPKKKAHKNLASPEGKAAFARNLCLMQLIQPRKPHPEDVTLTKGKLDIEAFRALCHEFSFLSILRNFDEFVAPFRK